MKNIDLRAVMLGGFLGAIGMAGVNILGQNPAGVWLNIGVACASFAYFIIAIFVEK